MIYNILATLVEAIHVAYVLYVVLGLLAILVGAALGWKWIRNPWFRVSHFLMIGFVAFEAVASLPCPLTEWGDALHRLAGNQAPEIGFMARLMHGLIHFELPQWVFNVTYVVVALVVLSTFWFAPVRWRRPKEDPAPAAEPVGADRA
jgi:hypothetical protein